MKWENYILTKKNKRFQLGKTKSDKYANRKILQNGPSFNNMKHFKNNSKMSSTRLVKLPEFLKVFFKFQKILVNICIKY